MGGYALLAIGLINWRYQSGVENVATRSLILLIPGLLLIAATFITGIAKALHNRTTMMTIWTLVGLLVAYSFII